MWDGFWSVLVLPSPKSQDHPVTLPVVWSVKSTIPPTARFTVSTLGEKSALILAPDTTNTFVSVRPHGLPYSTSQS